MIFARHRIPFLWLVTISAFWIQSFATVAAQDSGATRWPQWRGPSLDNRSSATGVPVEFGPDQSLVWKAELPGPGGASPIVWDDLVYVTSAGEDDSLWLLCFGTDGTEKWRLQLKGKNSNVRDGGNSASPSPCTDGEHVWASTAEGFIQCFDREGNEIWTVDLQAQYGEFDIQFGWTSTPVLDSGKLYVQMIHGNLRDRAPSKGIVVALDASTGNEVWKHERRTGAVVENKHSYASPLVVRGEGVELLLTHGADFVIAHSLEDGSELWRSGGLNPVENYNNLLRFVSSPVFAEGQIVVPSAKNGPVYGIDPKGLSGDVTDSESAFRWRIDSGTPDVATPLLVDGLVYLARENGILMCLDATTGEEIYSERLYADRHRSTPVWADGRIYIGDRDGQVLVVKAGREPEVLARNQLGEDILASPAVTDGRIYIRTEKALYCFGQ